MAKRLAKKVILYTDGSAELQQQVTTALGNDSVISIDNRRVTRLEKVKDGSSEVIIHLDDGSSVSHGFVVSFFPTGNPAQSTMLTMTKVHKPKGQVSGPFVEQLSLEINDMGVIKTSQPFYETSVPGVFAVGDCAAPMAAVTNAVAMGSFAAGGLAGQLGAEPTEGALAP
jgi:thioredoxin reductase